MIDLIIAPVALVKRFVADMRVPWVVWRGVRPGRHSAGSRGGADHAAEILGPEGGILVGEHIGLDVPEGCLGFVVNAVVEGLDDLFLEAAGARVRADDSFAVGLGDLGKG